MNRYQRYALGIHLCGGHWQSLTYRKILKLIETEANDPRIEVWEPFARYDPDWIIESIENMVATLKTDFPIRRKRKKATS